MTGFDLTSKRQQALSGPAVWQHRLIHTKTKEMTQKKVLKMLEIQTVIFGSVLAAELFMVDFKYRSASRKGGALCKIFQVATKIAMEG